MEWISVKERLPEPLTTGVVATDGRYTFFGWFMEGERLDGEKSHYFVCPWREGYAEGGCIVRWAYLPEPPKEADNDKCR